MSNIPKDPVILLSFVNTQLRDHFNSFEAFCNAYMADAVKIRETLHSIDYTYDLTQNQFI